MAGSEPSPPTALMNESGVLETRMKGHHGAPDQTLLDKVVHRIVEVAHPQKVILFGSAARGEMGPDSDLDFLVIVKGPVHQLHLEQEIYTRLPYVGVPVDAIVVTEEAVQRYGNVVGTIIRPALKEGKVVYAA